MSRVAISSTDRSGVDTALETILESSGCAGLMKPGLRVLIKPNWNGCGVPGSTSLEVVLATCRWLFARGAGEVVVGDGPVPLGRAAIERYFEEMDAPAKLASLGAGFINFDDGEHRLFHDLPDLPDEIGVTAHALTCDLLINIALLKVHSCCLSTLCTKNLKGCLRPDDKMAFHRIGLLPAIVALNRIVRSDINIVDAIDAMEGDHNAGELVHMGLLFAGTDRVAVDAVASEQIGLESGTIPLLALASEAGLGQSDTAQIEVVGERPPTRIFELPQEHLKRLYPDLEIDDDGACSACRASLMDGLYAAGSDVSVASVALGTDSVPRPDALVLGRCMQSYWSSHPHVAGCPPKGADVAKILTGGRRS